MRTPKRPMVVAWLLLPVLGSIACGENAATPGAPGTPEPPAPPPYGAWLDANVEPFDGSHLSLPHDDLDFLRDLVGDARIVALGENTHGTRDSSR